MNLSQKWVGVRVSCVAMTPAQEGHVAEGGRWMGRSQPGEALTSLLPSIPRAVYAQTLLLTSPHPRGAGISSVEKYPAGRAPVEGGVKGGWDSEDRVFSPLLTDVYWAGFWEKARLHQTGPEGLEPDCGLRRRRGLISWGQ